MSVIILLDAGPLGMVTNPKRSPVMLKAAALGRDGGEGVIATTNVRHLAAFTRAHLA